MLRIIHFYENGRAGITLPWWIFAVLGMDLILLGLLIVIFPRLLVWLIAGCLMFSGFLLLGIGWKFWR